MTIAMLAYALVFGSLVAAAAAALDACLRLGKRATRGVWVAALGVTLAGTALASARTLAPSAADPMVITTPAAVLHAPSLGDRIMQSFATVRFLALRIADGELSRIPAARVSSLDRWLAVGWVAASLLVLALLIAVHAHFRRARRAWPRTTVDGTTVRLAPRTGPAVIGLIEAEIVVPAWLMTRASVEQRLVLDHEREHLRARDPLLLSAAYVATALMPWHPAMWWMLARLRLAVELDCDARVLRRGTPAGSYGALLIDLAGCGARPAGVPVLGLTLTNLERRLIAMTSQQRAHSAARRGLLGAAALVAFAIACNAPVPTSPRQTYSLNVPVQGTSAGFRVTGDSVVYHIDGALASSLQAESLRVHGVPLTMLVKTQMGKYVRTPIEVWITTEMRKQDAALGHIEQDAALGHIEQDAALGHIEPDAPAGIDRIEALREKIQVDSALRDTKVHMKRPMLMTDQVLIDGRPASILTLRQLSPDLIKTVDVMKRPDSTSMIRVTTKVH